jgi:hypothetical protein
MDAQATFCVQLTQPDPNPLPGSPDFSPWPAQRLLPSQRQDLAIQVLAGARPVDLAREHQVSRKFIYHQAHAAQQALDGAFNPSPAADDVLFYRPVTKAWLRQLASHDIRDPRRWTEEAAIQKDLRGRIHEIRAAVAALADRTVRASSLVENLNSRLRNYFFLRRHLGPDYLALLQFFLNHRRLERSDRAERVGKTPAEILTRQSHPHWLEMLGFTLFRRA